KSLSR
ncbi:his Kinase A domain protein, partial [Vibrio parahaemolyticus V-223/04]